MLRDRSDHRIGDATRDADRRCCLDGHASRDDGAADRDGNARFDTHGLTHGVRVSGSDSCGVRVAIGLRDAGSDALASSRCVAANDAGPARASDGCRSAVERHCGVRAQRGAGADVRGRRADDGARRNAAPSAQLVWTVAWRATDPLAAAWYRQTSRTELGRGRWGTAELGGAGFELRNDGATNIVGELSYTIGSR